MENHPIPQDITGFKFRLIGSITVKQFLYLLGAGAIALILYFLPIPIFIKIPAMFIPAIISLALAFVPIDGRPMDKMIANFAKTIPSENQYIYHKKGVEMPYFYFTPAPQHAKQNQPAQISSVATDKAALFSRLSKTSFRPDEEEQTNISSINSLFKEGVKENMGVGSKVIYADRLATAAPTQIAPVPPPQSLQNEFSAKPFVPSLENKAAEKIPDITNVQNPPVENATAAVPAQDASQPLSPQQTTPIMQATPMQTPINPPQPTITVPSTPAPVVPFTPPPAPAPSQFDFPNAIKGVVKDPRGKVLPHIIVEILDNNNIPQRTFRTNQDGVFAAATAMPNGFYTIHLEDTLKKQDFKDLTIELSGSILPPLEIISVDQREKLRQELFGVSPHA